MTDRGGQKTQQSVAMDLHSVNRRRMIQLLGVGGIAGLAGCGAGDGSTDETTTTAGDTTTAGSGGDTTQDTETTTDFEPADDVFDFNINQTPPSDTSFNPYNPNADFDLRLENTMFDYLARPNLATGGYDPLLLDDFTVADGVASWQIRDGYAWHDGDDLTAEDLATQLKLDMYTRQVADSTLWFTEVNQADGQTVDLSINPPDLNPDIFHGQYFSAQYYLTHKTSVFGDWVQQFEDATTDSERESVSNDLVNWRIDDVMDVVGNSAWKLDQAEGQTYEFIPFEDYPGPWGLDATDVDFDLHVTNYSGTEQMRQAVQTDRQDVSEGPESNNYRQTLQGLNWRPATPDPMPFGGGTGFYINHDDPLLGRRAVRQALMHATPRSNSIKWSDLYPDNWPVDNYPTGLNQASESQWLGDVLDSFEDYGAGESNTDKATQLLQDEGFTQQGGKWYTPSGDRFTVEIKVPSWESRVKMSSLAAQGMEQFGIKTEVLAQESSAVYGTALVQGNFQLLYGWWSIQGHPWAQYTYATFQSYSDNNVKNGYPAEVEVPMPVGDANGSTQTINVPDKIEQLRKAGTDSEQIVRELAWVANYDVPWFPLDEGDATGWWYSPRWDIPDEGHEAYQHPVSWIYPNDLHRWGALNQTPAE